MEQHTPSLQMSGLSIAPTAYKVKDVRADLSAALQACLDLSDAEVKYDASAYGTKFQTVSQASADSRNAFIVKA